MGRPLRGSGGVRAWERRAWPIRAVVCDTSDTYYLRVDSKRKGEHAADTNTCTHACMHDRARA
jgi:hypothetical protein